MMKPIAYIETQFPAKFGIPRQSGLVSELKGTIVFEPEYRNPDAFDGLEEFSYIWLIWEFSEAKREKWSATVRPPRLGGNEHKGVFATRSPFRPNPIGLSSVRLDRVELHTERGPILHVFGADLMDHTPIYDIKPYIPYADAHPEARGGFSNRFVDYKLTVVIPEACMAKIPEASQKSLRGVLEQDPRPSYQKKDPERIYGFEFDHMEIKFRVQDETLTVVDVIRLEKS